MLRRIKESELFTADMQAPGKIVLSEGTNGDFVTHYENCENPDRPYLSAGHYFSTIEEAERDFEDRVRRKW